MIPWMLKGENKNFPLNFSDNTFSGFYSGTSANNISIPSQGVSQPDSCIKQHAVLGMWLHCKTEDGGSAAPGPPPEVLGFSFTSDRCTSPIRFVGKARLIRMGRDAQHMGTHTEQTPADKMG